MAFFYNRPSVFSEEFNRSRKDNNNNQRIMGEIMALFYADFLPVVIEGTTVNERDASLNAFPLWEYVKTSKLITDMEVQLCNEIEQGRYVATLLKVGVNRFTTYSNDIITLNRGFSKVIYSTAERISKVYPKLPSNMGNRE
ncbi:hypothetical protein AVEN_131911-1 [Araneus ventricosus]|uniref:Uncharacterized protein n=1 Tax=Araneus ventricosus TaxID=182803 RepID=A0A4Y2W9P5_ARAVE|nr:hypothetical protein AVEN_240933-1 [Araneus ventricosus]GBO33292.1 hypothetical protein AVEN_47920-1 [Araneus ventricosus]GBO33294.1 hypothetical protein AVEN_80652-1 [Araneus ventricosus]GBO33295.1 hypothetical protein AVEN_131911-1 [Araneus ventricosus]